MKQWTKQQLKTAAALAQELQEQADPKKSVEENMQEALLCRADNIDAQRIVAELRDGIQSFHDTFAQTQEQGLDAVVDQKLDAILEGYTEPEQVQVLHELLTAFAQVCQVQAPAAADPAQLNEMKAKVREYLCQYSVLNLGAEGSEILLRELGQAELEQLSQAQDKAGREQYIALAFYIQQARGELDAVPNELSAQEIGALTAAAYESQRVILGGLLGKLDWESVKRTLMMIAGAAVLAVLGFAMLKIAAFAGTLTYLVIKGLVGMSVIGTVMGLFFGFEIVSNFIDIAIKAGEAIAHVTHLDEGLKTATTVLSKWFQETVRPKVAAFWQAVKRSFGIADSQPAETVVDDEELELLIEENPSLA